MKKIVIIKTGNSETLADDPSQNVISLGDIIRCTPLVSCYPQEKIYWISSLAGIELIGGISGVQDVLPPSHCTANFLEDVDILINLEQGYEELELPSHTVLLGFDFENPNLIRTHNGSFEFSELKNTLKRENKKTLQHFIFAITGESFSSQSYRISPKLVSKDTRIEYDVGLNWKVGKKWPTKEMPLEYWKEVEEQIKHKELKVSWQEGFSDLRQYVDWIASNKIIITNDSLGLHISLALKKRTLCLFGPTCDSEIYNYGLMKTIQFDTPTNYECLPCYSETCHMPKCCTNFINIDQVVNTSVNLLQL